MEAYRAGIRLTTNVSGVWTRPAWRRNAGWDKASLVCHVETTVGFFDNYWNSSMISGICRERCGTPAVSAALTSWFATADCLSCT